MHQDDTARDSSTRSNDRAGFASFVSRGDSRYTSLEGTFESEGGQPIYDYDKRAELLEQFYQSQLNKSPNR